MRTYLAFFAVVFVNLHAVSQSITVADFKKIIELPTLEAAKKYIESKGFKYYKVADSKVENVTTTSWSYRYNAKTDEATAWMSVSCDGDRPIRTYYEVFDFTLAMPLVNDVSKNNYTFENIDSDDEEFTSRYAIADYYLFQYQKKDTKLGYKFECIKKFSKADPLNGTSIKYYPHGNVKFTVEVRNGKYNGVSKSYNENGVLVAEGNWKDNKKVGTFSFYNENGVLTSTENYKYGSLAEATFYHSNGKKSRTDQYLMDKRSGESVAYDEEENIIEKSFYIADKLFGLFKQYVKGVESFSAYYANDTLSGMFTKTIFNEKGERYAQERGYYKAGMWDGTLLALYDKTKDTLWSKPYKSGVPVGVWKSYNIDGSLSKTLTFQSGTEKEEICYEQGLPVHKTAFIGEENNTWKFQYTYEKEGEKKELNFDLPSNQDVRLGDLFTYFEGKTQLFTASTMLDALHKQGGYVLENQTVRREGAYNRNNPVGVWKSNYLQSLVTSECVFNENGEELMEQFTNKKGKPFSGSLSYQDGNYTIQIKVKKGLKEGVTTITNAKDGMVKVLTYKKGTLVLP